MRDWKTALAAPFYIPGRTDACQPFSYAPPDQESFTVCGDTIAVLRIPGEHATRFTYYDRRRAHRRYDGRGPSCRTRPALTRACQHVRNLSRVRRLG